VVHLAGTRPVPPLLHGVRKSIDDMAALACALNRIGKAT